MEESGDHLISGTGEVYLDQLMHDVRSVFTKELEVKVTEPFVKIEETVCDISSVQSMATTPNQKNTITTLCEPIKKDIGGLVKEMNGSMELISERLERDFGWDALSAHNIWSFGPATSKSSVLVDYSLDFEMDKQKI